MFVDTRDIGLSVHIITEGTWEMWISRRFRKCLHEGANVVEVGANIGYYTILGASIIGPTGRYFAFEPNPDIFTLLYSSVDINGFRDRVKLINKAVYSESGKIKFYILERYPGSSSIHGFSGTLLNEVHDQVREIEVESITLDDYFADHDLPINLIKMDAEGSEPHIFRGMENLLKKNPNVKIICEFNPLMVAGSEDPLTFLKYIESLGFGFWKIGDPDGDLIPMTIDKLLKASHIELFLQR